LLRQHAGLILLALLALLCLAVPESEWVRGQVGVYLRAAPEPSGRGQRSLNLQTLVWLAFIVYSLILLGMALYVIRRRGHTVAAGGPRLFPMSPLVVVTGLVCLLIGLMPYLGLRTFQSFSMYSNLMTEGELGNHLFMGSSLQVFGYQRDLVAPVILEGVAPPRVGRKPEWGQPLRDWSPKQLYAFFTVRSYVSQAATKGETGIALSYVRNGKRYDFSNAETDPELSEPYSYLVRKFVKFRDIRVARETRICTP
jgi:hypothetical protein